MEEIINVDGKEYRIIKLLGHGKGGYSYLVESCGFYYVYKQIHHEPCSYYTFGNKIEAEARDYERLLNAGIRIPKMISIDFENERIIKEYISGDTIFDYVREFRHMSKDEVAVHFGFGGECKTRSISRYENNSRTPHSEKLEEFAKLYNVNINAIKEFDYDNPIDTIYMLKNSFQGMN